MVKKAHLQNHQIHLQAVAQAALPLLHHAMEQGVALAGVVVVARIAGFCA